MHHEGVTSLADEESALLAALLPFSSVPWSDLGSMLIRWQGGVSVITMCDNVAYMADTCAFRADFSTHANTPNPPSCKTKCVRLAFKLIFFIII